MLLQTELTRVFILIENGQNIQLSDPEPRWSTEAVLNHYSSMYPILTTAKISAPKIKNDTLEYIFESVMGTKG